MNADNARDVQVAIFAARNLKLPQVGQFSSAGPFFYGPWWYWFLELISFLPLGPLTHWYFMTLLSLLFIFGIYYLGYLIEGKWLGAFAALGAAISPAQIENSLATWNPTVIPLLTLFSLILLVRYYQTHKLIDIFLLGMTIGLALNIHFQSMLLLPTMLIVVILIRPMRNYLKHIFVLGMGVFIPFIPLIKFDLNFNWYNFRSIFIYLTVGQYNIWVPNRWLTYAGTYWPETWASIIGGHYLISLAIIILLGLFFILKFKTYKHQLPFYLVATTFLMEIILYRYYRGNRFIYYSFFAHPTIILLTAWVVYQLFKLKVVLGLVLSLLILFFSLRTNLDNLKNKPLNFNKINALKKDIYDHYPLRSFDIYACSHYGPDIAHPLALVMYWDNRNYPSGLKIETCYMNGQLSWKAYSPKESIKLDKEKSKQNFTTAQVFRETVEWWKDSPPK